MQPDIGWHEIAVRLFWTVIGGLLIGLNREEHGRAAGLRTTLLVCLAASFSMLQVNLLLNTSGKTSDSFVVMDLMRLPLGILSGMGFIGAGAILRRGNAVRGVTTAATLWFATVMGLCFGGGQVTLGILALALGLFALIGLKRIEKACKQDRSAWLTIVAGEKEVHEEEVERIFAAAGYQLKFMASSFGANGTLLELRCEVQWRGQLHDPRLPSLLRQFTRRFSPTKLGWENVSGH